MDNFAKGKIVSPVLVYALGGLGEVGKNTYCIENEETIIMIDAGVKFPEEDLPGVNYVIPDYSYLKNNQSKVKALFITHGHEDHIGGIPFLLQTLFVPVIYAPKLAAALIRGKLEEHHIKEKVKIVEYDESNVYRIGDFEVEFFHVTHSIPDAYGISVNTKMGRIVTTGDFKIDLTPIGTDISLSKMAAIGDKGVTLLLADSTNAEIEGYTQSERSVIKSINQVFEKAPGRLIISTFSSNVSRIQQIVEVAVNYNRRIVIIGRSMEKTITFARKFDYIKIPDANIIPPEALRNYKPNEIVIICTGSQGEPMAALSRISNGDHRSLKIIPGDTVVFSSSPIPGNSGSINKVVNQLMRAGANVLTNSVFSNLHASGHPAKQELRIIQKIFHPQYFMPVHGEYRMLKIHSEIAIAMGLPKDHAFVLANGDTLVLRNGEVTEGKRIPTDDIYIDGNDATGLSTAVIRDRKIMNNEGMIAVLIALNMKDNCLLAPPFILTKGLAIPKSKTDVIEEATFEMNKALTELFKSRVKFSDIKDLIRTTMSHFFYQRTHRNSMVIPVIMSQETEEVL